jgi:SSS family solute:Na+ symporter
VSREIRAVREALLAEHLGCTPEEVAAATERTGSLIAAIVSSLASMMNSISTIFTMDFYKHLGKGDKSEQHLVAVGRGVSFSALLIAMLVARPLLGQFDQAFQYIQEFTGFFTPGVVALFLLGIFWNKTTANGALGAAIGSAVL